MSHRRDIHVADWMLIKRERILEEKGESDARETDKVHCKSTAIRLVAWCNKRYKRVSGVMRGLLTTLVAQNEAIDANNLTSKTLAVSCGRHHSVGRRRAVQTTKQMLRKNQDTWRALLAYRLTPLSHGLSLQISGL
ncbi:hypothetical protein DAT39_022460 [Clarias magur]|uniref:Uncharacterized protein n=1 Tax=Clarias magur TaxID=1594786 RepID=A0A8J4WQZ2_CLAMG|nr:hypothetical protein DAT39_022460 [Clarias magur]